MSSDHSEQLAKISANCALMEAKVDDLAKQWKTLLEVQSKVENIDHRLDSLSDKQLRDNTVFQKYRRSFRDLVKKVNPIDEWYKSIGIIGNIGTTAKYLGATALASLPLAAVIAALWATCVAFPKWVSSFDIEKSKQSVNKLVAESEVLKSDLSAELQKYRKKLKQQESNFAFQSVRTENFVAEFREFIPKSWYGIVVINATYAGGFVSETWEIDERSRNQIEPRYNRVTRGLFGPPPSGNPTNNGVSVFDLKVVDSADKDSKHANLRITVRTDADPTIFGKKDLSNMVIHVALYGVSPH